jgi:ABC-2 type transport system permease protein
MNHLPLVISREYLSRVKKKSFLLTTFLVPLIIIGFYVAIIALTVNGSTEKQHIVVQDDAHLFNGVADTSNPNLLFTLTSNLLQAGAKNYQAKGFDAYLYLPADSKQKMVLYTAHTAQLSLMSDLESVLNNAMQKKRLMQQGIDPQKFYEITEVVSIENAIDSKEGEKKSDSGIAYIVSFACGFLIYLMMLIYGTQVMRGVSEEKTNRIAEVIVSSVKPFQLMLGKIIGIGAVGLTQFLIWIALIASLKIGTTTFFPEWMNQMTSVGGAGGGIVPIMTTIMQGLSALPLGKILFCFVFYFLGGYLLYASMFAALGSIVSEDPQEAQKMTLPITMPIILAFVIMNKALVDPNSTMAVVGSIVPLTSPIVMMARISYDVPVWQLVASMLALVISFVFMTWMAGRIYRIGILMYGKKPSWKELMKWAFRS